MKKLSCKKRKLSYIREKNRVRSGQPIVYVFKVSVESNIADKIIASVIEVLSELEARYKTALKLYTIQQGYDGDDFIRDLMTVRVEIISKHEYERLQIDTGTLAEKIIFP